LTILKQAQEDSAKIALSHHQQAMHSLLKEMKKDGLGGLGSQSLNAENELELKTLRERLLETEKELDKAYSKIRDLEEALNLSEEKEKFLLGNLKALEESQVSLERDLDDARRGWPPSMHHLENLTLQIRQLEQSSKKRESEIENLIKLSREDAAQAFAQDRQELLDLIQKKDVEILGFKKELDSMVSSILQLKKQQQQGHTFVNARQKLF
jgi:DNA repair exonuclease SbcCD ATPase subunit